MDKLSASEALFGFIAWLTSLETPVTFSSYHDASTPAQLVGEYCKSNNLAGPREGWDLNLVQPSANRPLSETEVLHKEVDRLRVQLAGCLVASEGQEREQSVFSGDYGWSPAYQSVIELRKLYEKSI